MAKTAVSRRSVIMVSYFKVVHEVSGRCRCLSTGSEHASARTCRRSVVTLPGATTPRRLGGVLP